MDRLKIAVVRIFHVTRRGDYLGFATSIEDAKKDFGISKLSASTVIKESRIAAGIVEGRLMRWHGSRTGGGIKLHWTCPSCGRDQWGDWSAKDPAPCVWHSECTCVEIWLITWTPENEAKVKLKGKSRTSKNKTRRGKDI